MPRPPTPPTGRIIGVLREDDDEPLPLAPAGENVEQLVACAAESVLSVCWETGGRGTAVAPGGVAERLLHRVAREALTNAARHAPGAPVVVAVTGDDRRGATVTISNGRPAAESSPVPGGGSGLLGLRAPPSPRSAAPSRWAHTPTGSASGRTSPRGRPRRSNRPAPPPPPSPAPAVAAFLPPKVARYVIEGLGGADGGGRLAREAEAHARVAVLSPREREVLGLVGAGLSNPETAARLHLVEGTVKAYVSAVLDRIGVRNRVQAAIVAHEAGPVAG